jgi:hypothetical protein
MQKNVSQQIVAALDRLREMNEMLAERTFLTIYGSPTLQAAMGMDQNPKRPLREAAKNLLQDELLRKRIAELRARISVGGLREALIRSLIYVGMGRAAVDERGFEAVRQIRQAHGDMPLAEFKALFRDQFNILLIDKEQALAAIPSMLPKDVDTRRMALGLIRTALGARGGLSAEDTKRLDEVAQLFDVKDDAQSARKSSGQARREIEIRAS